MNLVPMSPTRPPVAAPADTMDSRVLAKGVLGSMPAADRSPRVYSTDCSTFVDDHMVYAVLLGALAIVGAGRYLGLDRGWEDTALVKRFPVLK